MAAPIVVNPRREVPAWERLMPYLQQMAQQKRSQRFQKEKVAEERQYQAEQAEEERQRIKNWKPKLLTFQVDDPDNPGKKTPVTGFFTAPGKFQIYKPPKEASPNYQTMTLRPKGMKDASKDFTVRRNDPQLNAYLKSNIEVKTPAAQINLNQDKGITKATQTGLEKDIKEAQDTLVGLGNIRDSYQDTYSQLWGQSKAKWATAMDAVGMASDKQKEYLSGYTDWKYQTDEKALAYRKLITGVAGGDKEMDRIVKVTLNTKIGSPAAFRAKLAIMERNTRVALKRRILARDNFKSDWKDLTPEQKDSIAKSVPLDLRVLPGEETIDAPTRTGKIKTADDFIKNFGAN